MARGLGKTARIINDIVDNKLEKLGDLNVIRDNVKMAKGYEEFKDYLQKISNDYYEITGEQLISEEDFKYITCRRDENYKGTRNYLLICLL